MVQRHSNTNITVNHNARQTKTMDCARPNIAPEWLRIKVNKFPVVLLLLAGNKIEEVKKERTETVYSHKFIIAVNGKAKERRIEQRARIKFVQKKKKSFFFISFSLNELRSL